MNTADTLKTAFEPIARAFDGRACCLFTFPNGEGEDPDGNRIHYIANAGRHSLVACLTEWLAEQRADPTIFNKHLPDDEAEQGARMLQLLAATQTLKKVGKAIADNDTAAIYGMRAEIENLVATLLP